LQAVAALCDRALLLRPNQSPLLDRIEQVTSAYLSAGAARGDSRATLGDVSINRAHASAPLTATIRPGEQLTLRFTAHMLADLPRCAVELHVLRHDGLYVFDGVSFTENGPVVDVRAGSTLHGEIDFRANVLRGAYRITINLVDPSRLWKAVEFPAVASFVVEESTRWGGCAELEPRYRLTTTASDDITSGVLAACSAP
ncbi:MAG TPA: Wzt carbohydrate-binding domain-containing protein, partial [Vicinamibacterales bacterium]